ncbi:MAG: HAD-IC family P-type ATPase [Clostridiales bacterium]|nr:HAD-IC family P-type ATPase [Clostridiales bacterium]
MKQKNEHEKIKNPQRISASPDLGLSEAEVARRVSEGCTNAASDTNTRSIREIVLSNIFTYFNLVFAILAACVILVGSFRDLTFMPVVIINTAIGIFQEIRSKKTLDQLSLLAVPSAKVIRGSEERSISSTELVLDDIVLLSAGDQISADAILIDGSVSVNESLLTGESDEIAKKAGDYLLSGSFVVSGSCRARIEAVGDDAYISKLSREAKKMKKQTKSEMMLSLSRLVTAIGIIIIPVGLLLFHNQHNILGLDIQRSVVSSVAAVVGMIPEGLYLLTTVALAVSTINLARKRTLVHDLNCIEALARVNVLCVDKTGTITKPSMNVEKLVLLCPDRFSEEDVTGIIRDHIGNLRDRNETGLALEKRFGSPDYRVAAKTISFSSASKYSGAIYNDDETYLLGAPDILLASRYSEFAEIIQPFADSGMRVLLTAMYDGDIDSEAFDCGKVFPIALILLSNEIRDNAKATFEYFEKQGVEIKVISGDNPATVSNIALKAGIRGAENYIDATTLTNEMKLRAAATQYTVFGRVTPEQKKKLVLALKAAGKTVAMTGDGVNDVLALKSADCSIAMASGSDAACQVSQLVLLNSDFGAMPSVVDEGRRVINNIERSSSLFLVKNIFSFTLAIISMIAVLPYPVTSAQLSLVSILTIGIPSFFLALEPDFKPISGRFLSNVLLRALPAGLTDVLVILGVIAFSFAFDMPRDEMSTVSAILMSIVGLMMLYRTCTPFTKMRRVLFIGIMVILAFCVLFLKDLFALSPLNYGEILVIVVFALSAFPIMDFINKHLNSLKAKFSIKRKKKIG